MDNDPKHVEAAYERAMHSKDLKLQARIEKLEFALITISEVENNHRPRVPRWARLLAREALQ